MYIEEIYVPDEKKNGEKFKHQFFLKTSTKMNMIKCKSELDKKVWLSALLHRSTVAKEYALISDLDKNIIDMQTLNLDNIKKNSVIEREKLLKSYAKVEKIFKILENNAYDLFPRSKNPINFLINLKECFHKLLQYEKLKQTSNIMRKNINTGTNSRTVSVQPHGIKTLNSPNEEPELIKISSANQENEEQNYDENFKRTLFKQLKNALKEEDWLVEEISLESIINNSSTDLSYSQVNHGLNRCFDDVIYYLERLSRTTHHFFNNYFYKVINQRNERFRSIID